MHRLTSILPAAALAAAILPGAAFAGAGLRDLPPSLAAGMPPVGKALVKRVKTAPLESVSPGAAGQIQDFFSTQRAPAEITAFLGQIGPQLREPCDNVEGNGYWIQVPGPFGPISMYVWCGDGPHYIGCYFLGTHYYHFF